MAGVVVVHQRVRAELLAVWATRVRNMKNERARFAVLPIEPNHTFNFKDLYLVNKNTSQLRKFSVFCWDVDDQPIFLWNVLTKVNKQKKSKIILRFLVKSHNKCLLFFPTTTSGCCCSGWSCCAQGPGRYGAENSFRRREKAASTRAARIVVVFLVIRVDNSHGKLCFGLFFVKFLGINSAWKWIKVWFRFELSIEVSFSKGFFFGKSFVLGKMEL